MSTISDSKAMPNFGKISSKAMEHVKIVSISSRIPILGEIPIYVIVALIPSMRKGMRIMSLA